MELILTIVFPVLSLLGLVLFIIVLIKQFKHGGVLQGIIGIVTFGLWTFIWGWIKHKSLEMTKIMITWTAIQLAPIVLVGVFGAAMMGQMYKMISDLVGSPSLAMKQDQKKAPNPKLKKKKASTKQQKKRIPAKLQEKRANKASNEKNADWNLKALALWKDGQYTDPQKAKDYWDKVIAGNPKFVEAYNNRGLAFYNLKQYQEAVKDYSQAIRMKAQYAEAYNNRGNAYYEMDQYQKAEADFNKSLQIKPKYSKAHLNRGLVYYQMKKTDQACVDFRKACDLGECEGMQWAQKNGLCK
jgi:Flp pilus assembly protein TadD